MSAESQALATLPQGMTDALALGGAGFEDVFIRPTNIQLVQRTTRNADATPGKLFDVLTATNYDSLRVIPLTVKRQRALFPEGGELGAQPLCRSDNGIEPSPFVQYPQADVCKTCPKGSWENYDRKTGKGKPECKENWQLLCIVQEWGLPRRIQFGGTSLRPFKDLLEHLAQAAHMARNGKNEKVNLFDYVFTISPVAVQGKQGSFYVAKFSDVKRVAELGQYQNDYIKYVLSPRAQKAEQEEEEASASAVDAAVEGEGETVTI